MAESIDSAIETAYTKQNAPLPPEANDEVFLRRAYLGITGQIPSVQEASQFLEDKSPSKRAALINQLLDSPDATEHLFQHFAEMLRLKDTALGASQKRFLDWLKNALQRNEPYDGLVRSMITAKGTLEENPAVGWLLAAEGSLMPATLDLCNVWLGYNMQCAICHDSPYSDATQMQFYQLAAHFGATRMVQRTPDHEEHVVGVMLPLQPDAELAVRDERTIRLRLPQDYKYRDGNSGDPVRPWLPQINAVGRSGIYQPVEPNSPLTRRPDLPAPTSLRESLAHWVTVANEARFSHVIAARLWTRVVGEGSSYQLYSRDLREPLPVDSVNSMVTLLDPPPSRKDILGWRCHAGLFTYEPMRALGMRTFSLEASNLGNPVAAAMASVMRDVSYDLREFQRVIWNTRAAQREAMPDGWGVIGESRYTVAPGVPASPFIRRMTAEQIWDALISLAGKNTTEKPSRELPQVLPETHPLRSLGRGSRGWSDDSQAMVSPTVARWMIHSPLVLAVTSPGSRVIGEMERAEDPAARIRQAFLAILSRPATAHEEAKALDLYRSMDTASADSALVWSLVNTSEFLFLH